jgi:hypothetical protein
MSLALCAAACGGDTSGQLVQVGWRFEPADGHFTTRTGWDVTLDEARLGIGAAYLYAPQDEQQSAVARLSRAFVSIAHAHGGVDPESGRRVLAELLDPVSIDLLSADATTLPRTAAETGSIDALTVELSDAAAGLDGLHGGSVYVRGEAVQGDRHVRFEAMPVFGSDLKLRRVQLLGLHGELNRDAALVIHTDPSVWFAQCEFDRLQPSAADGLVTAGMDDEVGRALAIGVRDPEALQLSVEPGADRHD